MLSIFRKTTANDERYTILKNDLHQTACDLRDAYNNLEHVVDPDLIDCYIYEVNAVMKRYRYLLNQAAALTPLPEEDTFSLNPESPVGTLVG